MDVNEFIRSRQHGWSQLDELLAKVQADGLGTLRPEQVRLLHRLYRQASADLILAQTVLASGELVDYLNDLVARGYSTIYATSRPVIGPAVEFFAAGFPRLVRRTWRYTATATAVFLVAAMGGFVATVTDPDAADFLLPESFARLQRPSDERQRGVGLAGDEAAATSAHIMTNNIRVTLTAFASGLLTCIATVAIVFYNGVLLGSLYGKFYLWDVNLNFWSLIVPHGVIELPCIFIGSGGGLMLGVAVIAPGNRTRAEALVERGRDAVRLLLGVAALLVVAGLIEGFFTPLVIVPPLGKIAFSVVAFALLVAYLSLAGRRKDG